MSCLLILVSNLWQIEAIEAIKAVSTAPAADIAASTGAATHPAIAGRFTLISVLCNATAAAVTAAAANVIKGSVGGAKGVPEN